MNRLFVLFISLFISHLSFSSSVLWKINGQSYGNPSSACSSAVPALTCDPSNSYSSYRSAGAFSGCSSMTCTADVADCLANGSHTTVHTYSFATISASCSAPFVMSGTCPNYSCRCPGSKVESNGQCVDQCPSGQVKNDITGKCQPPCPAANTQYSEFESAVGETYPGEFCTNGCAVRSEVVVDICGAINIPGAVCEGQGNSFVYTGAMCGDENPPPSGPNNPPSCPQGTQSNGNGMCLPNCGVNQERGPDNQCKCVEGTYPSQGQCLPDPSCEGSKELYNHQCVERCGAGETRGANGQCVPGCPAGNALVNGQCVPVSCPSGQHLENGKCSDNPPNPNCGEGEVSNPNGQCVPGCPPGMALVNGQCVSPTCPDGQTYNTLFKKCVGSDAKCPAGSHKEGLNCVSDKPPDVNCPAGSHKVGETCVSDTPPGPGCPAGSTLVNGRCESNKPPDKSCPAGQHKNGDECVSDEPPKDGCGEGKTMENGQCTGDPSDGEPPTKQCPEGQTVSGNQCMGPDNNGDGQPDPTTDTPTDTCIGNKLLKGGKCVDVEPPTKKCPQGMTLTDGKCVSDGPPIETCPTGQTLEGGKCIVDGGPTVTCPTGQTKVGNECLVDGTGSKCPAGQKLAGNKCILVGGGGSGGGGSGGGDGTGTGDGGKGDGEGGGEGQCDPATQQCGEGGGGSPPGPVGTLYTKKGRAFADVLAAFSARVQSASLVKAGSTFFTISSFSVSCPVWTLPASEFYPSIDIEIQCSPAVQEGLRIAGIVFLLVCAWVAFRIAVL